RHGIPYRDVSTWCRSGQNSGAGGPRYRGCHPAAAWTRCPPVTRLDCMVSQTPRPPAPLDPGAVAQALAPFGESRMLPRAAYVDPAVFEWEKRHMFGGGWVCAGRSDQVAPPRQLPAHPVGTRT